MSNLPKQDYLDALERMKNSSRDRIGVLGELGATGLGVSAGVAASGTIAAAAGTTTLLGSSTLGATLGGVFVTTTPIGWVVGAGLAAGAAGYGISKLVRSGGSSDAIKKMNMQELKSLITRRDRESEEEATSEKMNQLISAIQVKVTGEALSQEKATVILSSVENGELSIDFALQTIQEIKCIRH